MNQENQENTEECDLVEQALIAEGRALAARLSDLPPDRLMKVLNEVREARDKADRSHR